MTRLLVRGGTVVTGTSGRDGVSRIEDGAVLVDGAEIAAVDDWTVLRARHPNLPVTGSDRHVVLPGLVNAHHHVGLTPVQLGSLDEPLELWAITRLSARDVDPYLDTLYSAFEMLASGVTTVQHIFAWPTRDLDALRQRMGRIIQAYIDVGMRVSFSMAMRDQNRSMLLTDEEMLAGVPKSLRPRLACRFETMTVPLAEQIAVFEDLLAAFADHDLVRIQLAPGNLHWCSDSAIETVQRLSERHHLPLHIHLLETAYQKEYARRRTGGSALDHLHRFGMTGPHVTIGHGVWMSEADVALVADTGTHVCHNCSSNLRLRSGILPLNRLLDRGISVALGIDEAGINDDRDMLQEMRLVLRLHREPGMDERYPTATQVLHMATEAGAATTPFADRIGRLAPGYAADLLVIDQEAVAGPYLDSAIGPVDAVLNRAKPAHVKAVMVAGREVVRDGEVMTLDSAAALTDLKCQLAQPQTDGERDRRDFAAALYEPVRRLYSTYLDAVEPVPFWAPNSRR
ncbi:MAG: amidohydrolase family protein [Azospirillaceae bacterium]